MGVVEDIAFHRKALQHRVILEASDEQLRLFVDELEVIPVWYDEFSDVNPWQLVQDSKSRKTFKDDTIEEQVASFIIDFAFSIRNT